MPERQRILVLFSDTGGGHRSAGEAVIEALQTKYPGRYEIEMVDALTDYAPRPLNRLPPLYPKMVRLPQAWGLGFKVSDGLRRARALTAIAWPYVRPAARRILRDWGADIVVSVHPVLNAPILNALRSPRSRFITLVTDLVSAHALWYDRRVDLCLVPTEPARQKALECGLRPDQVRVVGLPVSQRFSQEHADPADLRRALGWPPGRAMVLLVGGGEGMGPLFETARAIAANEGDFGLAVVTGRNERLRQRLESVEWEVPTFVYGFEQRMPELMGASDLLVTKAGPGTIAEALNAGLPMVLYSRLPGQEDGNVRYVVEEGVGTWAPSPEQSADAVRVWLSQPDQRERAARACRRIARPQAASEVADIIAGLLAASLDPAGGQA
jgi:1,2-diacylglycerol 3-beta-galactosyltransferase